MINAMIQAEYDDNYLKKYQIYIGLKGFEGSIFLSIYKTK